MIVGWNIWRLSYNSTSRAQRASGEGRLVGGFRYSNPNHHLIAMVAAVMPAAEPKYNHRMRRAWTVTGAFSRLMHKRA